jgi:hypothetical protein
MDKLYSAVLAGKNTINVFDVRKGIKTYSLNLGNVEIVNGPVVTQNKMTVVTKDSYGKMRGKVYSLPKGILSYSFQVN